MLCNTNMSESQILMFWRLIIEGLGPITKNKAWADIIVSDMIIKNLYAENDWYNTSASKDQICANNLFLNRIKGRKTKVLPCITSYKRYI